MIAAFCFGWGVIGQPASSGDELAEQAEAGLAEAQTELGARFFSEGDFAQAVFWIRKAAEQGFAEAQSKLGYCYSFGKGVPADQALATEWYQKAAAR